MKCARLGIQEWTLEDQVCYGEIGLCAQKHKDHMRSSWYHNCWEDVYDHIKYACICDHLRCVGLMGSLFLVGTYI